MGESWDVARKVRIKWVFWDVVEYSYFMVGIREMREFRGISMKIHIQKVF